MRIGRDGQHVTDAGIAGVIVRPLLLLLTALLLGVVSDRLPPWPFGVPRIDLVHKIIAGFLILLGLALAPAAIRGFSRATTPGPRTSPPACG